MQHIKNESHNTIRIVATQIESYNLYNTGLSKIVSEHYHTLL